MILNHVNCLIHEELFDFMSCWIVFIHVVRRLPGGLLQFSKGAGVEILASVSSGIRALRPNREKRCAWTVAERRNVAWLSISPRHFAHAGIIWFLTAFAKKTTDRERQSLVNYQEWSQSLGVIRRDVHCILKIDALYRWCLRLLYSTPLCAVLAASSPVTDDVQAPPESRTVRVLLHLGHSSRKRTKHGKKT